MAEDKGKNSRNILLTASILFVIAVVAGILALFLTNGKETHTVAEESKDGSGVLYCESRARDDAFFKSPGVINEKHELKIIFQNQKAGEMSYTYTGKFNSNEIAESNSSSLHAKYNLYMADIGLDHESLSPTFSIIKSDVVANLYITQKIFSSGLAQFMFLTSEEYSKVNDYTMEEFANLYSKKGFSCTIRE